MPSRIRHRAFLGVDLATGLINGAIVTSVQRQESCESRLDRAWRRDQPDQPSVGIQPDGCRRRARHSKAGPDGERRHRHVRWIAHDGEGQARAVPGGRRIRDDRSTRPGGRTALPRPHSQLISEHHITAPGRHHIPPKEPTMSPGTYHRLTQKKLARLRAPARRTTSASARRNVAWLERLTPRAVSPRLPVTAARGEQPRCRRAA
jgi:hypothetical protein